MKKKILVVHDDREIRDTLVELLTNSFEVILADDGMEAWEIFISRDIHFDTIITDLIPPRMNGLELLKKVREINCWIPIIVVTNKSTQERAEEAANLGVSAYLNLNKPVDLNALVEKIIVLNRFSIFHPAEVYLNPIREGEISNRCLIVQQALTEVHKKFNKKINLNDITSLLGISKEHLCRIFKKNCNVTLCEYIRRLKINMTIKLLKNRNYSLNKIAELVGFYDTSHLIRTFKKTIGISPRRFACQLEEKGEKDGSSPIGGHRFVGKKGR